MSSSSVSGVGVNKNTEGPEGGLEDEPDYIPVSQQQYVDRAAGAIIGSIIGDALGGLQEQTRRTWSPTVLRTADSPLWLCFPSVSVGCHWYYSIPELQERYGDISYYVKPAAGWYHSGLQAGDWSQTAEQAVILLESLTAFPDVHYRQSDFCERMDALLDSLDLAALPRTGRAGYVDRQVRDLATGRRVQGLSWTDDRLATWTDTSEASQRGVVLSARYGYDPSAGAMAQQVWQNTRLTYQDPFTIAHSIAYLTVVTVLIQGRSMTLPFLQPILRNIKKPGLFGLEFNPLLLPSSTVPTFDDPTRRPVVDRTVNNPDALLLPLFLLRSVEQGDLTLKDDRYASLPWGQSCSIPFVLGSSYYLAHKFRDNFSAGICAAANGGGQNVSRCAHVGGLIGAQVGLSGIEQRWIDGLKDGARLVNMAKVVAEAGGKEWAKAQQHRAQQSA